MNSEGAAMYRERAAILGSVQKFKGSCSNFKERAAIQGACSNSGSVQQFRERVAVSGNVQQFTERA